MFALVFLFGLRKEVKQDMSMGLLYLGSFFSLLAAFVVLWQMITLGLDQEGGSMSVAGNTLANDTRVLYGAYQIVIAGICLPFGAFLFRNRKIQMYVSGKSLPRAGKLFQPYYMDIKTCIEYFFLIFNVVLLYQLLFNSHSSPIQR